MLSNEIDVMLCGVDVLHQEMTYMTCMVRKWKQINKKMKVMLLMAGGLKQ